MKFFSWSEIECYMSCPRKWKFAYKDGYRRREESRSGAAYVGRIVDDYIQSRSLGDDDYITQINDLKALELSLEERDLFPEQKDKEQKNIELCFAMFDTYDRWIEETGANNRFHFTHKETRTKRPLYLDSPKDVGLHGWVDMLAVDTSTDITHIFENKTTTTTMTTWITQELPKHLWQAKFYAIVTGLNHVVFNVMRRTKGTPRAARPLVWRYPVFISDEQKSHALERFLDVIGRIVEERERDIPIHEYFPVKGRKCQICRYVSVCDDFDSPGSGALSLLEVDFISRKERKGE